MNILFVLQKFPVTSETFVHRHIKALSDAGHTVSVLVMTSDTTASANTPETHNVRVIYPPKREGRVGKRLFVLGQFLMRSIRQRPKKLYDYLRTVQLTDSFEGRWNANLFTAAVALVNDGVPFDIVCCHFGVNGVNATELKARGFLQGKVVTIFHGFDVSSYLKEHPRAYDQLRERGDLFLTVNRLWKDRLEAQGFPQERTLVHHMGVDCAAVAHSYAPPKGAVRLLSVARLVEKKGLIYAIRAIPKLIDDYPDLTYTIIGDGSLKTALQLEVRQLGIEGYVEFLGAQPNDVVFKALSSAHVLLAPSVTAEDGDMEGIPVAMMEAMAAGIPVLSTWHSGIPELIDHGISGYLVPERDSDALAVGLLSLLSSPDILCSISNGARAKVRREFDTAQLDAQFAEIINRL